MKKKIIYILAIICCMSLFSSAKQTGKKCAFVCQASKPQPKPEPVQKEKYDLSRLSLFLFNL